MQVYVHVCTYLRTSLTLLDNMSYSCSAVCGKYRANTISLSTVISKKWLKMVRDVFLGEARLELDIE